MLKNFFKKKSAVSMCKISIVIQTGSISIAVLSPEVCEVKQLPCANNDYARTIMDIAQDYNVENAQCYIVLTNGMYQDTQIDKPNVPEAEFSQALSFSAKDFFTIAPQNQLLDFYQDVSNNTNNNKLNVVACDSEVIKPILDALQKIKIDLVGISIEDIVLTHFVQDEKANLVVYHSPGNQLLLCVIKNGEVCFSRHIHGYDNLHQLSEMDFEGGVLGNLSLEAQRSIDYSIGQLKLESIENIYLCIQNFDAEVMVSSLQELFDIKVSLLTPFDNEDFLRFPMNYAAFKELEMGIS